MLIPEVTPEVKAAIIGYAKSGATYKEISDATGVEGYIIVRIIKQYELLNQNPN